MDTPGLNGKGLVPRVGSTSRTQRVIAQQLMPKVLSCVLWIGEWVQMQQHKHSNEGNWIWSFCSWPQNQSSHLLRSFQAMKAENVPDYWCYSFNLWSNLKCWWKNETFQDIFIETVMKTRRGSTLGILKCSFPPKCLSESNVKIYQIPPVELYEPH